MARMGARTTARPASSSACRSRRCPDFLPDGQYFRCRTQLRGAVRRARRPRRLVRSGSSGGSSIARGALHALRQPRRPSWSRAGQWAWRTRFDHVGWQMRLPSHRASRAGARRRHADGRIHGPAGRQVLAPATRCCRPAWARRIAGACASTLRGHRRGHDAGRSQRRAGTRLDRRVFLSASARRRRGGVARRRRGAHDPERPSARRLFGERARAARDQRPTGRSMPILKSVRTTCEGAAACSSDRS